MRMLTMLLQRKVELRVDVNSVPSLLALHAYDPPDTCPTPGLRAGGAASVGLELPSRLPGRSVGTQRRSVARQGGGVLSSERSMLHSIKTAFD